MASLAAHLVGDHEDALPFNPSCPICRTERLAGHLPATRIISDRMRAGLVTGVLAVSVAVPVGTVGATPATAQSSEEETGELDEVVGDELTPEELAELEALLGEGEPPPPPAEPEPAAPADPAEPVEPEPEPVEPAPVAPAPAAPAPAPAPQPAPAPAPAPAPVAEPDRADRPKLRRPAIEHTAPRHVSHTPAAPAPRPVQAQTTPVKPAPVHVRGPRYRVAAGDSLWSIAYARLGRSATPAQVAAEVQRLWELNRAEIATGSPNLIHPGTWLVLRLS